MKRVEYPAAIRDLIAQLKRMPGIGPRSAERIALWLVQSRDARPKEIAESLRAMAEAVRTCVKCGFFTTDPLCEICADESRAAGPICVVELATDILPLERTGVFRGTMPWADVSPRSTTSVPATCASTRCSTA